MSICWVELQVFLARPMSDERDPRSVDAERLESVDRGLPMLAFAGEQD